MGIGIGRPIVVDKGTAEGAFISWGEGVEVCGLFAVLVAFYEEVDVAGCGGEGDGGIGPEDR